jgi:hypothetical protein
VVRTVRSRLVQDLGIDPGPALQAAHRQVLAQPPSEPEPAGTRGHGGGTQAAPDGGLVGRAVELEVLRQMLNSVFAGGTGVIVVEGEPGAGKTRLLAEMTADAMRGGALVAWGSCLEGEGTPSMWPWVQAVRTVLDGLPVVVREAWLDGALGRLVEPRDDFNTGSVPLEADARFWLFEQVVGVFGYLSGQRPVIVVIDDLQWADAASLQLFGHLAARLPRGAMIASAVRERAPVPDPVPPAAFMPALRATPSLSGSLPVSWPTAGRSPTRPPRGRRCRPPCEMSSAAEWPASTTRQLACCRSPR